MAELSAASVKRSHNAFAMLQLYHQVVDTIVPRLSEGRVRSGTRELLAAFANVDRHHTARNTMVLEASALLAYIRPIFPLHQLSDQDLLLLLVNLSLWDGQDRTMRIDVVDFFCAVRQFLPFQAWQAHEAVRRARSALARESSTSKVSTGKMISTDVRSVPQGNELRASLRHYAQMHQADTEARHSSLQQQAALHNALLPLLVGECDLSYSQADQLLRYVASTTAGDAECGCASELYELLFAPDLTVSCAAAAMYLARFAEATLVPSQGCSGNNNSSNTFTGTLALLAALRDVNGFKAETTDHSHGVISHEQVCSSLEADVGAALLRSTLDASGFVQLCLRLQTGLTGAEQHTLYDMLIHTSSSYSVNNGHCNTVSNGLHADETSSSSSSLCVYDLVRAFRHAFPRVTHSLLQIVCSAVYDAVLPSAGAATDFLVFVRLYDALEEYEACPCVPLESYVRCLRACGVGASGPRRVRDIELEWLRLRAPTRRALLTLLCLPLAPSREAIVRKVYESVMPRCTQVNTTAQDVHATSGVTAAQLVQAFVPTRLETTRGGPPPCDLARVASSWKAALVHYLVTTTTTTTHTENHLSDADGEAREAACVTEGVVSYERFAFFFALLSAGVRDDPTFTMLLWQSFDLSHRVRY